jgi:type I restriction enzyme S subunit
MSEWEVTTLGEVCQKVMTGGTPLSNNEDFYKNGTIPWLRTKEVNFCRIRETESYISEQGLANSAAKVIPPNSVIIAMHGQGDTAGRVAINEIPLTTNQACCNLVIDERIADYNFVYFYLKNSYRKLVNAKTGSVQPNLNTQIIKDFPITLPPLQQQKEISAVLVSLDRKIENLRKQNETLEAIAQTLFKHWFVDFEFPNEDGKPYKSSGGEMVRSELGEIPAGWHIGVLEDIVDVFTGYPFKSDLYSFNSGIRVVRGENVSLGFLRWDMEKRWEHDLELYSDYLLQKDDYVIGMDGSRVGRNRSIILSSDLPLILAQRVARLRAKNPIFTGYINTFLNQDRFERYVDFIKTGTSIPHISSTQIKDFECLIPAQDVVSTFDKFYQSWVKKVSLHLGQIQTLTKTRDVLLPKLMSGKLRISE